MSDGLHSHAVDTATPGEVHLNDVCLNILLGSLAKNAGEDLKAKRREALQPPPSLASRAGPRATPPR